MSEDRVLQALRALAASDGKREAPPAVEARLLREFRGRRCAMVTGGRWIWDCSSRRWCRVLKSRIAAR